MALHVPHFVYCLTCAISGKLYFGITRRSLKRRWGQHLVCAFSKRQSGALQGAIRKYGADAFSMRLVYEAVNEREAVAVERGLIAAYGTMYPSGYNMTTGGETNCNLKMSPFVVEKNRLRALGIIPSQETRAKMSAAHKGSKRSVEGRLNMKLAAQRRAKNPTDLVLAHIEVLKKINVGRVTPPHVRAKLSAALKGKPQDPEFVARRLAARRAAPDKNRDKTHCVHGHEYTEENTYRWRGERQCRTCMHARRCKKPPLENVTWQ